MNLDNLSQDHRTVIYEVLKDHLPQSGPQVYYLLNYFTHQGIDALLKTRLPKIIQSGIDFKNTLEYLSLYHRELIYKLMRPYLPQMIHTVDDLKAVLAFLTSSQRIELCTEIKTALPNLLLSTEMFVELLWILPLEGRNIVYHATLGKPSYHELNDMFLLNIQDAQLIIKPKVHLLDYVMGTQDDAEQQRILNVPKMRFELALANGNLQAINKEFNTLMRLVGTSKNKFFTGGHTRSCTELIKSMAHLPHKQYLAQICDALNLTLEEKDFNSPERIEKALLTYLRACQTINVTDSAQVDIRLMRSD